MKAGDRVSYCSVIGQPPTSFGHTITHIKPMPNDFGHDVAWITQRAACVALAALVPEDPKIRAMWSVELNTVCPKCEEWVDLLDYADFWDGRSLTVGETDTQRSRNVEVVCPNCNHEFEVDLEY